jgi:curved DNA-binding protein CbpA
LDKDDYYKTLGVLKEASDKEIKSAYRRLARKYHPDRNSNVSDDIMKKINIAFEVLSDPEKRYEYNKFSLVDVLGDNDKINDDAYTSGNVIDSGNYQAKYKRRKHESSTAAAADTINDYPNNHTDDNGYYAFQKTAAAAAAAAAAAEPATFANDPLAIPESRYHIIVEPSLCLAFGSCETLAPKVFVVEKDKPINPKAIVKSETGAEFETILDAAKTCPTKAIIIIDRYTGERIFP